MPIDDYIKRSDVEAAIKAALDTQNLYLPIEFLELLWGVPAADVVSAPVRCSDCRFYDKRDGGATGGMGWCSRPGAGCGVPEEFFCAGAEKKEEK